MALLRQVDRFHFASITEATGEWFCFKGPWLCNQPFAGMLWVIREQLYARKNRVCVCVCERQILGLLHEGLIGCHSVLNYLQLSTSSLNIDIRPLLTCDPWQITIQMTDQMWFYLSKYRFKSMLTSAHAHPVCILFIKGIVRPKIKTVLRLIHSKSVCCCHTETLYRKNCHLKENENTVLSKDICYIFVC